jgi:hypothetical protein
MVSAHDIISDKATSHKVAIHRQSTTVYAHQMFKNSAISKGPHGASFLAFQREESRETFDLISAWEDLFIARDNVAIITALATFSKSMRESPPSALACLVNLPVAEVLLSLYDIPDLVPFTDNITRAIDIVASIPGMNFEPLCGNGLLGRLLATISPKARDPTIVLRMIGRLASSCGQLAAEFVKGGDFEVLIESFRRSNQFVRGGICNLLEIIVGRLPVELIPACRGIAEFVRAQMDRFPEGGACCMYLFMTLMHMNEVSGNALDLDSFDFSGLYRRLTLPLTSENRNALLGIMRCLFKQGFPAAIEAFEWRFLSELLSSGFEEDFLPLCKLIPIAIRRRPDSLEEAFKAGLPIDLVRIGEKATFPVKKWAFRSVALLIELDRDRTVMALLETNFVEQLAELLEGTTGKLLECVLECIFRLEFAMERFGAEIWMVFAKYGIPEKVGDLEEELTPDAGRLRYGILGLLRSFLSESVLLGEADGE